MAFNEKSKCSNPVVAMKLSSIIFPSLLSQLSNIYKSIDEIYKKWCNKYNNNEISKDIFINECRRIKQNKSEIDIENIFNNLSSDKKHIKLINLYDLFSLHNIQHKEINYNCLPYVYIYI